MSAILDSAARLDPQRASDLDRSDAAMREDAERYRWLRDVAHPENDDTGIACTEMHWTDWGRSYLKHYSGEQLDAAIDIARATGEQR